MKKAGGGELASFFDKLESGTIYINGMNVSSGDECVWWKIDIKNMKRELASSR